MTKEQMRIVVTEIMGWKHTSQEVWRTGGEHFTLGMMGEQSRTWIDYIPNYPEDLNACAEFEKTLIGERGYDEYPELVYQVVYKDVIDQPLELKFPIIHVSASQRCEAFIRLHGRWID